MATAASITVSSPVETAVTTATGPPAPFGGGGRTPGGARVQAGRVVKFVRAVESGPGADS